MAKFLTIDLGTTLLKFAIFDDRGSLLAIARIKPPTDHPKPGECEIDVARFRRTIKQGIGQLRSQIGTDDIAAISFASQANSFTLLDPNDGPLCPLILWPDARAFKYEQEIQHAAASIEFREETGLPHLTHQFAVAKFLRWHRENAPILQHSPRLMFISDLITYWLTHQHVTEASIAGLCGALNIHTLKWRADALADFGLDAVALPKVARAGTDLGLIDSAIADEFGLPRTCRFVVGCLDQFAGAIGTRSIVPRAVCETTGTVLAAVRCTQELRSQYPPDVFVGPSFNPQIYFEMSLSNTSANLLEHYRNSLADHPDFTELTALAEHTSAGDLRIEPLQSGTFIDESFRHVKPRHSRGQVVRAIMECVARQLTGQIRALCGSDLPPRITSAGGGARSDVWLKIKSEHLGIPFIAATCVEPTSLGAAMLASRAVGVTIL